MRLTKRIFGVFLSFLLLLSCLACQTSSDPNAKNDDAPIALETNAPQETVLATPEPTPALVEDASVADAFDALDLEMFQWYASMDGFSFHMLVSDPAAVHMENTVVPMTLGEFTEEDTKVFAAEAEGFLAKLAMIDREKLDENRQFSYDVVQQMLEETVADAAYEYFYEPLTAYTGIHSNLPISFALFELKDVRDVEDYLTLLADTPRYFGQVVAYEQERAKRGMFMTEQALDTILADCDEIIDSKDSLFLIATFADALDGIDSLTEEQKTVYRQRNEDILQNEFNSSYKTLRDGLADLRRSCRKSEGAALQGEEQKEYFAHAVALEGNNQLSVEETLELLREEYGVQLMTFFDLQVANEKLPDLNIPLTSGNMETDIDELKRITAQILPALPEHSLTLQNVPEELEEMFSPAAYAIPAIDEWNENTILINLAQPDDTLFLTLAHEGYPGHLYQYVYQRGLENVSLMQKSLHFGAYAEGWSQLSEYLVSQYQTTYQADYVQYNFAYSQLINTILPSICSILVNYYAYSEEALATYINGLGLMGESIAPIYYPLVIDQPYYFLEYGVGYAQMSKLLRTAQEELDASFEMSEFLKAYLDLGAGYFNLVQERMDVWIDERVQDDAAAA